MTLALRAMRNEAMAAMLAPAHRFFTPTEAFFNALEPYREKAFVDAGTGLGQLPDEARERGFKMQGIDLMRRPGQSKNVAFRDAETFQYSPECWLLMCRPDHSGWAYEALEAALKKGANVFYAGLARNFVPDLDDYAGRFEKAWKNVGKEGEALLLFTPACLNENYLRPWD